MKSRFVVVVMTAFVSLASFATPPPDKGRKAPMLEPLQVIDANGKTVGRFGPAYNNDLAIYGTFNGVFAGITISGASLSNTEVLPFQRDPLWFESTNCTGTPYMVPPNTFGVPTMAVKIGTSVYVYTANVAARTDMIALSEMSNNGSCETYPVAQSHPSVYPATGSDLGAIHPLPWTMQ